jgi:Zn-finger nucleic acid-binding protein
MRCPIDGEPLRDLIYEDAYIHTCPRCEGELIGGDALAQIVRTRETRFGPEWESLLDDHAPLAGTPASRPRRGLNCPFCQGAMQSLNYASDASIVVERCGQCGAVWLDRHELELIQVLMEKYQDEASGKLRQIAGELEAARREAARRAGSAFEGSRFAFVNAIINRLLDAA